MDYFTKWPEARAIKEATADEVAKFIYEDIICRHGCPYKILSDRGSHFNNQIIKELTEKFEIKHNLSTPYHPKTNGLVERFNKTLCEALAKSNQNSNWDEQIPAVLFAYRTTKHSSTKIEPFHLTYGRIAKLPMDLGEKQLTYYEYINEQLIQCPEIREKARLNIEKAQNIQKNYHDKRVRREQKFRIGDKVLYYNAAKEKQWSGKLEEKWRGPFLIHEELVNGSYKIKEYDGRILKTPINGELLKKYQSREQFIPYIVI